MLFILNICYLYKHTTKEKTLKTPQNHLHEWRPLLNISSITYLKEDSPSSDLGRGGRDPPLTPKISGKSLSYTHQREKVRERITERKDGEEREGGGAGFLKEEGDGGREGLSLESGEGNEKMKWV